MKYFKNKQLKVPSFEALDNFHFDFMKPQTQFLVFLVLMILIFLAN